MQQLASGQRHLQLVWEEQQKEAKLEREALQNALKSQATIMANNQLVHETAIKNLTDTIAATRVHPNVPSSVLQRYQEGEDPDAFFTNFERVATSATWPQERWGQYIAPLLTGTLQAAYQAVNPGGITPYNDIKKSILERVGFDSEHYRVRFRKAKWGPNENPRALYFRIKDLGLKWLGPIGTNREDIIEIVLLEQYLDALPPSTRNWIKQHPNPDTSTTIELACAFHRSLEFKVTTPRSTPSPLRLGSGTSSTVVRRINDDIGKSRGLDRPYIQQPQCFSCGEWGHIARGCPLKTEKSEPMEIGVTRGRVFYTGRRDTPYKKRLIINGKSTVALIDSGCSQSVVRAGLFDAPYYTSEFTVSICCIHGETREYPLIWITLTWGGQEIPIRVGLVEQLVEEAIIGTDFSEFPQLLDSLRQLEETNNWWKDAPFSNMPLSPSRVRPKLTRKEKRIIKKAYNQDRSNRVITKVLALTALPSFRTSQREDPSLIHAWKSARPRNPQDKGPSFTIVKDLLYRVTYKDQDEKKQLIVPEPYRQQEILSTMPKMPID
ncbi:hypothetical protein NDU88_006587 [Pleurodeles waltl]|uniref:CCHC-type domain-containing protein n=1 Tax=Pleurodeles waltl TaxID=8319 RepID=A0AAV7VPJ2_PLEWA|nr:hypothetical protein NDU88_006587 [Pleurodeles waltl]